MPPYCKICDSHHSIRDGHGARPWFVPVPAGMSVEDATQALADHVQWVPLSEAFPDGTPVPDGTRVRSEWLAGTRDPRWFIHPDDVPTDSDAELIEAIVDALSGHALDDPQFTWEDAARDALAVVREHRATVWDEGFEAGHTFLGEYAHGSNGPSDPPPNPYDEAGTR